MNRAVSEIQTKMKTWTDAGIELAYNSGYEQGCKDRDEIYTEDKEDYNRGLNDAWECARKIVSPNAIPHSTLEKIFGYKCYLSSDFIEKYSVSEAIAKVKEYEDKQTKDDKQDKENKSLIKIKSHNFVGKQYVLYEDVLDLIRQIKGEDE